MNVDYFEQMEKDARASTRKVLSLESDLEEQKRKKIIPRKYVDGLGVANEVKEQEI